MWRRMKKGTSGLAALLLVGMASCVDLVVTNPNDPDAERALSRPQDTEALIAGGFNSWHGVNWYSGAMMFLSNASGQHAAPWANAGMEYYARIPRVSTVNQAGDANVGNLTFTWTRAYRAISAVVEGLKAINTGKVDLPDAETLRAQAYGKFLLGLAHGTVAAVYDSGFVYDETKSPDDVTLQGYPDVMTAALGYLAEAATLAGSGSFTIPATWMTQSVTSAQLAQLAHSWAAIFRASVARTPAERAAANWTQIVTDVNAGVTADWNFVGDWINWYDEALWYATRNGWSMMNNWVLGMADQSGAYQAWIAMATPNKMPFLVVTPDTRFPQGATESAQGQTANRGEYYHLITGSERIWSRADRGTWRWSYYRTHQFDAWITAGRKGPIALVTRAQMRLLLAEAAHRAGDRATAASMVNETRTLHGLSATDAAGLNTSCVPKLPNGSCGDLWEMLKWEARMEYAFKGLLRVPFYFDARGWGDLMEGTLLQLPVPYREMELILSKAYNLGGVGGVSGAPKGTYGY